MRHLLCARPGCGDRHQPGRRQAYAATPCEPAEWIRVLRGRAKAPTPAQRVATVNGTTVPLPVGHFDCDVCGQPIRPGDVATAVTAWQPYRHTEPPIWELAYLDDPTPTPQDLDADYTRILEQEPRP